MVLLVFDPCSASATLCNSRDSGEYERCRRSQGSVKLRRKWAWRPCVTCPCSGSSSSTWRPAIFTTRCSSSSSSSSSNSRLEGLEGGGAGGHRAGDVVGGKYVIVGVLGQGGIGTTYEAEMGAGGERVALKAISLRSMKGWKELDLFEREARVLKSLQHPGIPAYLDYLEVDGPSDRCFYMAQKLVRGQTLAQLVHASYGWRGSEEQVERIAVEVLRVVDYLGSLRPPVFHRDIKPDNILLEDGTGSVKVVDFGAVQEQASQLQQQQTWSTGLVAGTYGYMAPEQFQNRACMQTDLYGLGATLLFLLSGGRNPSSFPQHRLRLQFRDSVAASPGLADIVERLLEPAPEDRFQTAHEVILAFNSLHLPAASSPAPASLPSERRAPSRSSNPPVGSRLKVVRRTEEELEVSIPAAGLTWEGLGTGSFAVAWNAFLVCWTGMAVRGGAPLMAAVSLPFWVVGAGLARNSVDEVGVEVELRLRKGRGGRFTLARTALGLWRQEVSGETADLSGVHLVVQGEVNGRVLTACQLQEGARSHSLGGQSLQAVEKEWLMRELTSFLGLP